MVSGLLSPNTRDTYEVTEQKKGSFHVVYVLRSSQGHKFCLKIPAQGQEGRWSCDDAILLRSEALTMRLIQQKTKVPVPTMLAYDATLGNEVGAPFILMSYIEGEPLSTLWNQWIEDGTQAEKEPLIYAALTHAMADLSLLTFNKIGMLSFPDDNGMPIITDRLESRSYYDDDDAGSYRRVWKSYGPFETSKEYYMDRFNANKCLDWDGLPCGVELAGVRKFLDVCMASIPASLDNEDDSKEVFGLAHDDLDLENTLFDEDCNLVGIIDWDKVHMAPIYLSYGAVPLWLHEDWNPSYNWPYGDVISSPWTLAKSRQLYGSALRKHLSKPDDWLVPEKSVILAVLEQAFKEIDLAEMRCSRFMTRIIPMIMPTVDPADFFHALSMNEEEEEDGGWAKIVDFDSKQCLIEQVTKLFRCLPKQPDGPKAQHIKEDDTSSYVDDEAVNGKIEASSDETRVDA
ncbi:hypothetical protein EJ08DRAFT_719781 [Tothia fuscella]|uniref:Aminoglycoside phosphotransferase domain-containing protein n=1 Tax=Tothia fuscella TaxID=1048955 RepID=A0A9P4TWC8_9PEZI|nr:hypothetical protein EJ08DRAFT_719781 [Tothia fuscella]